jgi:hypothetical protein
MKGRQKFDELTLAKDVDKILLKCFDWQHRCCKIGLIVSNKSGSLMLVCIILLDSLDCSCLRTTATQSMCVRTMVDHFVAKKLSHDSMAFNERRSHGITLNQSINGVLGIFASIVIYLQPVNAQITAGIQFRCGNISRFSIQKTNEPRHKHNIHLG